MREYADHRGVSVQAVRKAILESRLATSIRKDGRGHWRVDPDSADAEWSQKTNPAKGPAARPGRKRPKADPPPVHPDHAEEPDPLPDDAPLAARASANLAELERLLEESRGDFGEVRALREEIDARVRLLDLEKKRGDLVEVGPIERELATRFRAIRDAILSVPEQAAAKAEGRERHEIVVIFEAALVKALERHAADCG